MRQILNEGVEQKDRTGTGTREIWAPCIRYDLQREFPILLTKKVSWRSAFVELVWMIKGERNIEELKKRKVRIWNEWADENGDLGPIYGPQWRGRNGASHNVDQLGNAIRDIRTSPHSRRIVVCAWNPADNPKMALSPCHMAYQFNVANGRLNTFVYQRSADWFLGVPFNLIGYAALTHIVAHLCDLQPGQVVHQFGSAHLYLNHLEQAEEQLSREVRGAQECNPTFSMRYLNGLDELGYDDLIVSDYSPQPTIKAEVSV